MNTLGPNTNASVTNLRSDVILVAGEDRGEVLDVVRILIKSRIPTSYRYRCYEFWPFRSATVILTGIGTGSIEPLMWEILQPRIIRRIILIGTAGLMSGIVPNLEALGLLTEIDMMPIEAYCVNYARWKDAEEKVAKMGPVVKTTAGNIIQNPFLGVSNTAQKLCYKFAVEFGFTPSSRSRLMVSGVLQKPLPMNSMARFLAESRQELARQRAKEEFETQQRLASGSPVQLDIQGG